MPGPQPGVRKRRPGKGRRFFVWGHGVDVGGGGVLRATWGLRAHPKGLLSRSLA